MSKRGLGAYEGVVTLRGYDAKFVSDDTALDTGSESKVRQSFADEVDINTIMRRFGVTRQMPSGSEGGVYGDFSGITDYESAVAAVERARDGFLALPPDVRERFANDPGVYLEHVDGMADDELGPEAGVARVDQLRDADGRWAAKPPVAPVAPVPAEVPKPAS